MITYVYSNGDEREEFDINPTLIPDDSLLNVIYRNRQDRTRSIAYTSDPNLPYVINYIKMGPIITNDDETKVLDYWDVDLTYDTILDSEYHMRENIYNPMFSGSPMNTDQYYQLRSMGTFFDEYETPTDDTDITQFEFYIESVPTYKEAQDELNGFGWLFDLAKSLDLNIIIAGESVFDALMGTSKGIHKLRSDILTTANMVLSDQDIHLLGGLQPDVSVFITTDDPESISDYINTIAESINSQCNQTLINNDLIREYSVKCDRTSEYVSITGILNLDGDDIVLARVRINIGIYKTYSEVLHGFVVNCECLGWDGTDIWATERCIYSLYRGYNIINPNLDKFNSYYTYSKYAIKGIGILRVKNQHILHWVNRLHVLYYESNDRYNTSVIDTHPDQAYSVDRGLEYYMDRLVEYIDGGIYNTDDETLGQIEQLADNDQIYGLVNTVTIVSNDPAFGEIVVIEGDYIGRDVIQMLTIGDLLYELMNVWTGINLTKDVQVTRTQPGHMMKSI